MYGKTHAKEARKKMSEAKKKLIGEKHPHYGKPSPLKNKTYEEIMGQEKAKKLKESKSKKLKEFKIKNSKIIKIFDENHNLILETKQCFLKEKCKELDIPYEAVLRSFKNNEVFYPIDKYPKKTITKLKNKNKLKYKDWYAIKL
jgi:hypothetical protein